MITAFTHAALLDGTKQMTMRKDMTVIVKDGRIQSVTEGGDVPEEAQEINLAGKYLMPGLINMHCHLPADGQPHEMDENTAKIMQEQIQSGAGLSMMKQVSAQSARMELMSGVTTIRTVGGTGAVDAMVRDEIKEGKIDGPRILASNEAVSVPGGHMAGTLAYISHSVEEAVELVHRIAQGKPDLIKLMVTGGTLDAKEAGEENRVLMPPEQIEAACCEAHKLGYPVAAHVQGSEGMKVALRNGVDTIEHGGALDDELVELFRERKGALIATFMPVVIMACLPQEVSGLPEKFKISCDRLMVNCISGIRRALQEDIPVGMGIDNGCPYVAQYSMWRELDYFCRYVGVAPEEALYIATLGNARIAGVAGETGSVEVGKSADFVITSDDPLISFSTLSQPDMVVMAGKIYDKPQIDKFEEYEKLLDSIEQYDGKYRTGNMTPCPWGQKICP